jgi:hypothetical protein
MQGTTSHGNYGYTNNDSYFGGNTSRQGDTFLGYDGLRESEVRSTRMRSTRKF